MATNATKFDDAYGYARPVQDGPTSVAYPFIQNGDTAAKIYSHTLVQRESSYVPLAVGTEKDNVWEGGDPNAYNLPDGTPERIGISDLVRFFRSYARIPGTQTSYPGAKFIQLPSVPNDYGSTDSITALSYPVLLTVGKGYFNQDAQGIYIDYQRSLFGATKTCGNKTPGYATGGTFTLTYGANTTASLNWNDSGATIATALNGLASMSGLTASVTNLLNTTTGGSLLITFSAGYTLTPVTMTSSLTLTASNHPTTQVSSNVQQDILMADNITITSHGLDTAKSLAVVKFDGDQIIVLPTAYWGSVDSNTIWTPTFGVTNPAAYVGTFKMQYFPGRTYLVRTRLTEDFFLPGVTAGITTAADITVTIGLQNPTDFINALLTLTGWQTYETEGPAFWLNGPIFRRAYTAIKMEDFA